MDRKTKDNPGASRTLLAIFDFSNQKVIYSFKCFELNTEHPG